MKALQTLADVCICASSAMWFVYILTVFNTLDPFGAIGLMAILGYAAGKAFADLNERVK